MAQVVVKGNVRDLLQGAKRDVGSDGCRVHRQHHVELHGGRLQQSTLKHEGVETVAHDVVQKRQQLAGVFAELKVAVGGHLPQHVELGVFIEDGRGAEPFGLVSQQQRQPQFQGEQEVAVV